MPYVQRNEEGYIIARFANLQTGIAEEWIDDGSPELTALPKSERISVLQSAYEIDLDKLNKAWLAALIADGEGEVARQYVIKSQMDALGARLEMDILNIIMEA